MSISKFALNLFNSKDFKAILNQLEEENDLNITNFEIYKSKIFTRFLLAILLILLISAMCLYSYKQSGNSIPLYLGLLINFLFTYSIFLAPMKQHEKVIIACTKPSFVTGQVTHRWLNKYMRFNVSYIFHVKGKEYRNIYYAGIGFYFSKWPQNKPIKIVYATTNPKYSCLFEKSNFMLWCLSKTKLTRLE
ncbi:hypothetical protein [Kiloniella litopenaei]|uniref:hypothetical protein n=1 Tax=Kiloniella litopenaei TaxID=1549748 RepID=UPI003BAA10C3